MKKPHLTKIAPVYVTEAISVPVLNTVFFEFALTPVTVQLLTASSTQLE